eukprot:5044832-Pyramimonas_sp.AAC.1
MGVKAAPHISLDLLSTRTVVCKAVSTTKTPGGQRTLKWSHCHDKLLALCDTAFACGRGGRAAATAAAGRA